MSDPYPRRSIRRLAGAALLVLVALFLVPATGAAAKPVPLKPADTWGFAFNDQPTPVGDYIMPKERQWGSWKAVYPAEWASVTRLATGFYRVRFPHLMGKGIAHVTAVNKEPVWCQLANWGSTFEAEFVQVRCFKPGGAPADSAFSVLYTDNHDSDALYGWVHGGADGTLLNSFNSTGGLNAIGAGGAGVYKVWLPGLGSTTELGNVQVTGVNLYRGVRCKVANWYPATTGTVVLVQCHDALGAGLNTDWTLTFHHKANVFGASDPPKLWGYVWDTLGIPLPPSATNVNSQGGINTAVTAGVGLRMVTFPRIGYDQSHVQVTAFGPGDAFCNLNYPWLTPTDGTAYVRSVACYTGTGTPSYQRSLVTYTSRL